ncbi:hypothetical protein BC938DRAFT_475016, partial [Jimgerdemannia flammicorona]
LVSGNIIHETVDAIVNAANARLDHEGGIAKVIADAAGQQLRDECKNYIAHTTTDSNGSCMTVTKTLKSRMPTTSGNTNDRNDHPASLSLIPAATSTPVATFVKIVGDVGGVKSGTTYEILFDDNGHFQKNTTTGFKRPIMRKDIAIPLVANTHLPSSQVTSNSDE